MKKRLPLLAAVSAGALLAATASILVPARPAAAAVGLHVSGTEIVEANGATLVMRGVNHEHAWFANQTDSFADIKALGANTVRVVLSGGRWGTNSVEDVANVVSLCKENRLICVLEDHDTTGYGEDSAAYSLDQAVDYWISLKSALVGEESYVAINIGNEPIGNTDASQWTDATVSAIERMRDAGFEHLLMIDAPNWGQDWEYVMRDNAQTVLDADSQSNTVLSIHMYGVFTTASSITSYLDTFEANGWPLVIGEFGWQYDSSQVDDQTVMAEAVSRDLGYLGWSWAGNNDPILDMATSFDPDQLTTWGERIFHGTDGIGANSQEATIFGGASASATGSASGGAQPSSASAQPSTSAVQPSTASPSATTGSPSATSGTGCQATYSVVGQWPGGFQGEIKVTSGASAISGWTVTWTFDGGQTVTQAWAATVTSSGSTVTATNASYNGGLASGASASFGFLGSWDGANGAQSVSCAAR